jgi:hypothetical protein
VTDVATQNNAAMDAIGIPPDRIKAELLINTENISCLSSH